MTHNQHESNRNRNQHYVPENYFEEFSQDGVSIGALFKKSGRAQKNVSFKDQSSDHWFYGNAEQEDQITEFDTKYFHNRVAVLNDLANGASGLSCEQVSILLENVQFQRERTLSFRRAEQGVHDFHEDFFAPQVDDLKNYDSGHSVEATEAVKNALQGLFKALSAPKESQFAKLMLIDTAEVADLGFVILRNRTSLPFIFSDSPVAYTNIALSDFKCSKIENNSVGLQIFYPLNREFLALYYDASVYGLSGSCSAVIDITNNNDINQINKLQLHEATNSIYFGSGDDLEYVKMLWDEERLNFGSKTRTVEETSELTAECFETGRTILSIVEPEPSFYPSLSFFTTDLSKSNIPYREAYWRKFNPEGVEIPKLNDIIDRHSRSRNNG